MKYLSKVDTDRKQYLNSIPMILYFFTIVAVVVTGYFNNSKIQDTLKLIILSIILVSITLFYTKLIHYKLFENKLNCYILIGSYIFSFLCSMISFKYGIYNIWMIGPILIALIIDTHLGFSFHLLFTFLLGVIKGFQLDEIVVCFILGAMGCLLSKYMTDIHKIGYILIIFVSTNITLLFLVHNFAYQVSMNRELLYSVASSILMIISIYFIHQIYLKVKDKIVFVTPKPEVTEHNNIIMENIIMEAEEPKEIGQNDFVSTNRTTKDLELAEELMRLENLMREEHPLNRKLKRFSPKLYMKSELMGEVCFAASKKINADARLAGAGAFYHKIGRIFSKNYIEDGIRLLEENHAPKKVIDIVAEYHIKYGIPKSKEAAIVMLADSIISSIEVLEKTSSNPIVIGKLVDNVVSLRLSKGSLDQSGLTMMELKLLKIFFTEDLLPIMEQYKKEIV